MEHTKLPCVESEQLLHPALAKKKNHARVILNISTATIAFLVGLTANWGVNMFDGLVVDELYREASIQVGTFQQSDLRRGIERLDDVTKNSKSLEEQLLAVVCSSATVAHETSVRCFG
jgi:hypothetical protein